MKYIITTIILISCQYTFAQSNWQPNQHQGIPSEEKKVIFFDDFTNAKESWNKSDFQRTTTDIDEGKCQFSASKENQYIWQNLIMDKDGYEFEVKLSSTKNKEKEPMKIVLKGSKTEMLTFDLYSSGHFAITLSQRDKETTLQSKKSSVHINSESNIVLVREIGNEIYFFINGNFITSIASPTIYGYRFGVMTTPKNPITIDYVLMMDLIKSKRNADYTPKNGEIIEQEEKSRHKMD